ncbi:hypothetical protein FF38_07733 [Lucilia cuprina]|uniref:Uncharacterized protein n=1 Tax=Lucilia cuprina TaxID=7375 RepID=A0A0L0BN57_LUCCU|nr:hypothetical protein FF38_07733 [Lucilia cuprina]
MTASLLLSLDKRIKSKQLISTQFRNLGPHAKVNIPDINNCKPDAAGKRFKGTQLGITSGQNIVRTPLNTPITANVDIMTGNDLVQATTVRPIEMPTTPIRKKTLLSQAIFSVKNGTRNLVATSKPPSTDMDRVICEVSKPKSFKINGVNMEKFNSPKLIMVKPATRLTKEKSLKRSKSKKATTFSKKVNCKSSFESSSCLSLLEFSASYASILLSSIKALSSAQVHLSWLPPKRLFRLPLCDSSLSILKLLGLKLVFCFNSSSSLIKRVMHVVFSRSLELDMVRKRSLLFEANDSREPYKPSLARDNIGVPGSIISKPGVFSSSS